MADATTSSITIGADPEHVMAVIADFAAYPEWADQVKSVEILDTDAAGRPERVRFQICLLYTSPSPRDGLLSRMPSSA